MRVIPPCGNQIKLFRCFNTAAARITALDPAEVVGRPIEQALPLEDLDGRRWWQLTDPYAGLATRTGQPERNLLLPGGREVLVSARSVRDHPTGPHTRTSRSILRETRPIAPSTAPTKITLVVSPRIRGLFLSKSVANCSAPFSPSGVNSAP